MKVDKNILALYAVTDRLWLNDKNLGEVVSEAILGGATIVQLREKNLSKEDFIKEALEVKKICQVFNVPLIINDNLEVMLEVDADGIHVGQNDLDPCYIRNIIGKDKILGVSCQTIDEAKIAMNKGADYLGVGAMFLTTTKKDAINVKLEILKEICKLEIPVIAIGGITLDNIKLFEKINLSGIAVISAIFGKKEITKETMKIKNEVMKIIRG